MVRREGLGKSPCWSTRGEGGSKKAKKWFTWFVYDPLSLLLFNFQTEVKDLKKQLKRVEDDMKRSQTDSSKYYTILKDIYSKVHPAVNAPTSPTPSKTESGIKKEDLEESINGKVEVEEAK